MVVTFKIAHVIESQSISEASIHLSDKFFSGFAEVMIDTNFAETYFACERADYYIAVFVEITKASAICREMAMSVKKYF